MAVAAAVAGVAAGNSGISFLLKLSNINKKQSLNAKRLFFKKNIFKNNYVNFYT